MAMDAATFLERERPGAAANVPNQTAIQEAAGYKSRMKESSLQSLDLMAIALFHTSTHQINIYGFKYELYHTLRRIPCVHFFQ